MQFGDHFFCFSVFFFPCKSRTGTEHISQIMRLLVKLISQMRHSVFPPLFNKQRVVFIKEKQQTLRAISPPLLCISQFHLRPGPPGLLRGIYTPCQSRGWGICKFCTARGPGIRQPRGLSK